VVQRCTAAAGLDTITLTTGGILATTSNTLNVGAMLLTNTQFNFHTVGASTVVDLNGYLTGANQLLKAGDGTLRLNNAQYYTGANGTHVNGGTLVLNSGLANTILVAPTATVATVLNLAVNGGTLDLN